MPGGFFNFKNRIMANYYFQIEDQDLSWENTPKLKTIYLSDIDAAKGAKHLAHIHRKNVRMTKDGSSDGRYYMPQLQFNEGKIF